MIINGKVINGIYKHTLGATYTQNDLVLKGTTLYIALTEVPGSIDPSDRIASKGYYDVYLGDQMSGLDDLVNDETYLTDLVDSVFEDLMSGSLPDETKSMLTKEVVSAIIHEFVNRNSFSGSYISKDTLIATLSHYLTGVSLKGTLQVLSDHDSSIADSDYTGSNQKVVASTADEIIVDKFINNAVYAVDRELPGLPINVYSVVYPSTDDPSIQAPDYLLLRQYTYNQELNGADTTIRVQELIDHTQSMLWYRYMKLGVMDNPSDWKPITMNDTHVAQRIINLANEYKNRIIALYDVANQLRSNFRYHKVKLDEGATSYNAMNYSTYRITLEISKSSDIPGFSEISNATIDLSSNITKYKSGSTYIGVSPDSNGFKVITLYDDPELATISTTATISNAYIHEFYG